VYAEGQPDVRTFTTQDGRQGASLSLRIANIQLLGSKSEGGASEGNNAVGTAYASNAATMASMTDAGAEQPTDDLPF
jgi:single-strand DNA-binding protein